MILSTKPPFLFIHIPKTAGTSIEEALFNYQEFEYLNEPHPILAQYKTFLDTELYNSLFKFSFVRNPWALQVSTWKYYVRNNNIDLSFSEYINIKFNGSILDIKSKVRGDFDSDEQRNSCATVAFYMNRLPQYYFLIDEHGNIDMDFIGALETIQEDFDYIVDKLQLEDCFLPYVNRSENDEGKKTYMDYYDETTKQIVADRFKTEINLYGYEFDLNPPRNLKSICNKNLRDLGVKIPNDFFFNLGHLPYGLQDVKTRYDFEDFLNQKNQFNQNKINRRIESLSTNIDSIREMLENKQNTLFEIEDPNNLEIYTLQQDIISLKERELVYMLQLKQLEKTIR